MVESPTARLDRWKQSLLDLSASSRLLDARDSRTTIPLPDVDPTRLAFALAAGAGFAFVPAATAGQPDATFDSTRLIVPLPAAELARRLTSIRRAVSSALVRGGDHVLRLALGLLTWCEPDGAPHVAPLWLLPVELERTAGGSVRLIGTGRPPELNGALRDKLRRDLDLVLEPGTELDLSALFEAAAGIALTRPGWRLDRAAQLGVFSTASHAMWRDLDDQPRALRDVRLLAHLAGGAGGGVRPLPPSSAIADVLAPLDADASQLAVVAAADAGASFVLDGAAGTGKVQTIANAIAHCVGQGKTLLVIGEQLQTLRAIEQRLASVGLAELCVRVHAGGSDDPAAVVGALGRVLDRAFRPGVGPTGNDGRLAELRATLDDYAHALHAVGPFGRSVHGALARLVELRTAPRAELADTDAAGLDRATYERRLAAVHALAATALPVEPVASHAWRASTLAAWPADAETRARAALDEAGAAAGELAAAVAAAAELVRGLSGTTPDQLIALGALAAIAAASPRPGAEWLTQVRSPHGDDLGERIALIRARGGGSLDVPRDPTAFVAIATRQRALAAEVAQVFGDTVDDLDAATVWSQLRRWTGSMAPLRFVALRTARAAVRAAARPGELGDDDLAIAALEAVLAERACRAALTAAAEPARRWFGALGADPLALDLAAIDAAVAWAGELRRAFDAATVAGGDLAKQAAWRALVAQVAAPTSGDPGELSVFARLAAAVTRYLPARAELAAATGLPVEVLGAGAADHLSALRDQTEGLRHAAGSLGEWVAFHAARHACRAAGVGAAVTAIEHGDLGAAELAEAWERATLLEWADAEIAAMPALSEFHGATHHAHVSAFADLDRGALALARARTIARFAERVPRLRTSRGSGGHRLADRTAPVIVNEGEAAELELLAAELAHPTRALRELFAALPTVLPRIAPCLLMTPAAVAAYLDPALPAFDVVLVAGAAQLPFAHALGALARGTSLIAVGDAQHAQPDSVIAVAREAGLPTLQLAWHHRSRHPDLIALANARDYAGRLQVFPTPLASPELGISWRRVDGSYDRAGAQHNRIEATAIVAELLARLRDPAQASRSLAVIALGRAQHELIEDLLDAARAADPTLDRFFGAGEVAEPGEPVLVAHVDDVTADDRDVVLLSVGYDAAAPELWRASHDRPLATAIARARDQLVVFSSMAAEDLAAETATDLAPAVADLRALLAFAQAGGGAARPADDAEPATAVTAAIARALAERGWTVRHRVGVGPYTIDLAVVDPSDPERFVLAIEHDGPAYATASAARDRDRLRGQVLAQLGWRLHRIWALDWWADTAGEVQRAHGAIVAAIAATRRRAAPVVAASPAPRSRPRVAAGSAPIVARAAGSGPAQAMAVTAALHAAERPSALGIPSALPGDTTDATPRDRDPRSELSAPVNLARGAIGIGPYTTATIPAGRRAPDDLFAPRHAAELGKVVEQVLAAEAPMHLALLARRVGAYFGIGRVTQRVTDQIRVALAGRGRWGAEDGIVWRLDQDPASVPPVRVAGSGPEARRDIDEVPLSELAAAARIVVERATSLTTADLARDAARLLGFARITDRVIERIGHGMDLAATRELIQVVDGKATLPR